MTDIVSIAAAIKRFVCTELAPDVPEAELPDEESLLDSGILDSFGIMSLLAYIEQEYGVEIPAEDIEPENFETVSAIAETVSGYLSS
jgi:acyl carrier protein